MTSENKKKAITSLLVVVITLVGLVISATYAYYGADTSNSFGTKTMTAGAETTGSVALNGTSATINLNLTNANMRKASSDITYWGVTSGDPVTTQNVVTIGSTSVSGSKTYNCSYSGSVTASGTNNMYTAFQSMSGKSANQIVLKINNSTYDFNTANLFPISISGTLNGLTSSTVKNITAEFYLVNKSNLNQTDLAGTDISINISVTNFSCEIAHEKDYSNYLADVAVAGEPYEPLNNFNMMFEKTQIKEIEFLDTVNVPTDGTTNAEDCSNNHNGSIMVSLVHSSTPGYYKLYIGQDGGVIAQPDSSSYFSNFDNLTTITGMEYFDTSLVTNMGNMFYGNSSLTSLDVSHFNTSNVIDGLYGMFGNCSSLTTLNLSSFDTSNVMYMSGMFAGCSSLTSLDLSSFNTLNVVDTSEMFSGCSSLTNLNVSSFNTLNVEDMHLMFSGCSSLTNLNVSSFNTSNVENMNSMFSGCSSLTTLNVSNFNTSNVTDMWSMFSGCSSLTSLNISNFNTANVTNMNSMFYDDESLTTINLSSFNTSNVENMSEMFGYCSQLTTLNLSNFNTSNVTNMTGMFEYCSDLTTIYVSNNFDTSNVVDLATDNSMFEECTSLVGGAGTTYSGFYPPRSSGEYARIDNPPGARGYFTLAS